MENSHELLLMDAETNNTYKLIVSQIDFERAQKDCQFAAQLLFHAQSAQTPIASSVAEEVSNDCEDEEVSNDNAKTIYNWTYNQVVGLISSMNTHKEDLKHVKKRKNVFENIANDLISMGHNVTDVMVKNKWKSLCKSYSKAKDNKKRTGLGPSRFQFFDIMDELLGDKPSNSCDHPLNSSELSVSLMSDDSTVCDDIPSSANTTGRAMKTKRESVKRLERDYTEMKKEEHKRRQKRHEEILQLEREKMEIEKQKIELLQKILPSK